VLRLVNADAAPMSRGRPIASQPDHRVEAENHAAARLEATDARWVLAVRTTRALQGGRAAILRPAERRTLVSLAGRLGLRPFDAALVIAIAQDAARTCDALSGTPQDRLTMVRPPAASPSESFGPGALLLMSCFIGALFFSIMRMWLLG